MPRPKRHPSLHKTKEGFSAPRYIAIAAKLAAGHPEKDFSPWVVAAIEAKLNRENPGLIESIKADLLARLTTYPELTEDRDKKAAEGAPARGPWPAGQSPRERQMTGPAPGKVSQAGSAALKKGQRAADGNAKSPTRASRK